MSEIIGVVTEYNPFHNGHKYQLAVIRNIFGAESSTVCAMSGNFVQRGEPAIVSKFARAEMACRCGADIVAELPLPWSLYSAERFALGGVSVLNRFGINVLCFGAETVDAKLLRSIADETDAADFIAGVKIKMKEQPELSFAKARALCISERLGNDAAAEAEKSNNILAIEYIRAVKRINPEIKIMPVLRIGCDHDSAGNGIISSAADIRTRILNGRECETVIPSVSQEIIKREFDAGRGPVTPEKLDDAILSRLRMLNAEYISDCTENRGGLAERIYEAIRNEASFEAVCAAAKTGRYAMSAVKRSVMRSALQLSYNNVGCDLPPYARILALNSKGRGILRSLPREANILIKPSAVKEMDADSGKVFALNAAAEDLYYLAFSSDEDRKCGNDWKKGPVIVD